MRIFYSLLLVLCLSVSQAADKPGKAAIASAHPLATEAGLQVLREGGNAFDAAIAVSAVLAVVEPYSSGIGGGGFYLLHRAKNGVDVMIDARETAPLAASAAMYLHKNGEVNEQASKTGALAAGIPGLPAAFEHLAEKYGRLPLERSLAAAIQYAQQGFVVTPLYQRMAGLALSRLQQSPDAAEIFLRDGQVPDKGTLIKQLDLANTLKAIAQEGQKGFYAGAVASQLIQGVREANGIWNARDFSQYKVLERQPIKSHYRGMQITSAALPSSGGIVITEILNMLSNYDSLVLESPQGMHLIIEAMRRAYRDRAQYLGDPDFVEAPVARLMHKHYAQGLVAGIRLDKATPSELLPGVVQVQQGQDTTHFSILDKRGNRVSATLSINSSFGSGFVPPGTGVLLNNEMDDFSSKPGVPNSYGLLGNHANAIAPGKRMLSSMTPTFVEMSDRMAIVGTPGGSRIITMVLLALLEFHKGGSAQSMVALPRIHHQYMPDEVQHESNALTRDERYELQLRGHKLKEMSRSYGNMHVVIWDKRQKKITAASDPRGEGLAKVD